jgi:CRP/FNR family transcriptional regulator, cyclic AMP receptor protein
MGNDVSSERAHPFLRAMVPEHRAVVMQGAEDRTFHAGEIVFREGQPANCFYLIQQGRLALETHVPGKGDVVIASAGPGQALGWSWLVPPYVWHFQARALDPAQTVVLNGAHLLVASERDHYLGYELMKNISKLVLEVLLVAHQRWLETGHRPLIGPAEPSSPVEPPPAAAMESRVADHPFFHGMPATYVKTMAALAKVKEYEPGQNVFQAGNPADGLYVLERGRLMLESRQADGCVPVQIIDAGHAVGWSSFCEPYEWQFDVRALDVSTAIYFEASQVRERCAADYHLGYELTKRITRMMLQRLQATRGRIWEAFR